VWEQQHQASEHRKVEAAAILSVWSRACSVYCSFMYVWTLVTHI
jgi:hypothetical protein